MQHFTQSESNKTTILIQSIKKLMQDYKQKLKSEYPKMYSHELLNNLFRYPYTKIDYLVRDVGVTRKTASKYLDDLVALGLVSKHKLGKENFYLNDALFQSLQEQPEKHSNV
ncbi:MAG TPA: hypothetical protein PLC54_04350 [Spirochaetales bacterium]|nr:hypothetical protein [Spirochaetales bacterium]